MIIRFILTNVKITDLALDLMGQSVVPGKIVKRRLSMIKHFPIDKSHASLYCLFVDLCDIASQSIVNNILRFSNLATVMDCFEAMHEIAAYSTKFSLKSLDIS
ncbi:hypothetical protein T4D_11759 [Trichinella pseudospiralis]|uniref:Uncharacterized protein n=1 Tax=Trichinella pseudospiralis TaxID=6337 RepID=A0A0V1FKM4_TRIPS|nr:hypothetical protein T4D_11759 [Trichinella pseudospiralis]